VAAVDGYTKLAHDASLEMEILVNDKKLTGAAKRVKGSATEVIGRLRGDKAGETKGAEKKREADAEIAAAARSSRPPK
jgi:uncharacterized protein YjbJ (UPF0337 family)